MNPHLPGTCVGGMEGLAQSISHQPQSFVQPPNYQTTNVSMVAIMTPLDARIDPKIKCKIWQEEAVNLFALIKIQSDESAMQSVGIDGQGNLIIQNQPKRKIANYVQWNEAWHVFVNLIFHVALCMSCIL